MPGPMVHSVWTPAVLGLPLIDPIDLHHAAWSLLLAVPLVFGLSVAYKAMKLETLDDIWMQSLRLSAYILVMMVLSAGVLWGLINRVAP